MTQSVKGLNWTQPPTNGLFLAMDLFQELLGWSALWWWKITEFGEIQKRVILLHSVTIILSKCFIMVLFFCYACWLSTKVLVAATGGLAQHGVVRSGLTASLNTWHMYLQTKWKLYQDEAWQEIQVFMKNKVRKGKKKRWAGFRSFVWNTEGIWTINAV